jgi:hypothetical protein
MRTRMFVTIPKIFGILFPEYQWCTEKPVRLVMSMYGTTLCGKYWYMDLLDYLKKEVFQEGDCLKCFFIKEFPELDQSRYCKSLVKRYQETAGCHKVLRHHTMPLPSGFIPMFDDCSSTEHDTQQLSSEYNIDFASCVGSLIYLSMTRTDNIYAINKLAKYARQPGRPHFEALTHLLRYLRDNIMYGLR